MDPENLRSVPLFSSMADDDLRKIATYASEDSAPPGATLVREGDFSNDMVAIESGTADVVRDGETIGSLGPGDVFGEIGVLGKENRTATIVATSPMRLVRLDSWNVKRLPSDVRDRMAELVESRRSH
jgi:CRP-like cAMP-binding protein